MILQYDLHKLHDAADRRALFDDLKCAKDGLGPDDLRTLVNGVDDALSTAFEKDQEAQERTKEALDALQRLSDLLDDAAMYPMDDLLLNARAIILNARRSLTNDDNE